MASGSSGDGHVAWYALPFNRANASTCCEKGSAFEGVQQIHSGRNNALRAGAFVFCGRAQALAFHLGLASLQEQRGAFAIEDRFLDE